MTHSKTKKIILNLGIIFTLLILIVPSTSVFAIDDYTVLAPLPGTTECNEKLGEDCKTTLEKYLPGLFNLLIGLAAVTAVLRIVFGGILYMSSDALMGKEDGRAIIWNSIKGLVLVIGAWLILYTVNPALLTLNLNVDPVTIAPPPGGGGTLGGPAAPTNSVTQRIDTTCPNCVLSPSASYNLTQANVDRLKCTTCAPMDRAIPISSSNMNSNIEPDMNNRLVALNNGLKQQGIGWGVTEGYPPVVNHRADEHYNGTTVDAVISNSSATNVNRFINTAANNGLRAQFEVSSNAERDAMRISLVNLGMSQNDAIASVITVKKIRPHFSVYKK